MKLYDLARGSKFKLLPEHVEHIPPAAPSLSVGLVYKLHNLDGMYSYCTDDTGRVVHIAAYAEIVPV